jgi:hypothetical protein
MDGDFCEVDLRKVYFKVDFFELLVSERFIASGLRKIVLLA